MNKPIGDEASIMEPFTEFHEDEDEQIFKRIQMEK